ncbi:MAG: hypothetical protein ACXAC2_20795, partial [Candidatus Kariarchaeaceae archaeon]
SLIEKANSISLALSWKGLLFVWEDVTIQKLEDFIIQFDNFLLCLGQPELITDIRTWSFKLMRNLKPSDTSVFLTNFDMFSTLNEYCQELNQPNYPENIESDSLLKQLYQIEFILWFAKINMGDIDP